MGSYMTNKFKIITSSILLLILSGCGQLSDSEVLYNYEMEYAILKDRYQDMIFAFNNDKDLVEQSRLLGARSSLGFGQSLWQSFIGNEHLVYSEGAPLHRAEFIIKNDIKNLERHAHILESRLLSHRTVYDKIISLRRVLLEILPVLKMQKTYVSESQFIEQQRAVRYQQQIANEQLRESRKQTKLLKEFARNQEPAPRYDRPHVKKVTTVEVWQ